MAREVGIHIKVYDGATPGLKKAGSAVASFADAAKKRFDGMTKATGVYMKSASGAVASFASAAKTRFDRIAKATELYVRNIGVASKAEQDAAASYQTVVNERLAAEQRLRAEQNKKDAEQNKGEQKFKKFIGGLKSGAKMLVAAFASGAAAIGGLVAASLAFRSDNDASKKAIMGFGKEIAKTVAMLGDRFIPVLVALAQAFTPLVKGVQAWITANKTAMDSGIAEWAIALGRVLVDGVAGGMRVVSDVMLGWNAYFTVAEVFWRRLIQGMMSGLSDVMTGIGELALSNPKIANTLLGEGGTQKLFRSANAVRGIGHAHKYAADAAKEELGKTIAEHDRFQAAVTESQARAQAAFDVAAKSVGKASGLPVSTKAGEEAAAAKKAWEERKAVLAKEAADKLLAYQEDRFAYQEALEQKKADEAKAARERAKIVADEAKKAADKAQAEAARMTSFLVGGVNQLTSMISSSFAGIGKGGEEAARQAQLLQSQMSELGRSMQGLDSTELQVAKMRMADMRVEMGMAAREMAANTKSWADALNSLLDSMLLKLADIAAQMVITGAINMLTGGVGGFIGGALSAIGLFYKGGYVEPQRNAGPVLAYAGYSVPNTGAPGRDSVMIQAMPGERVLTRAESAQYARSSSGGGGTSPPAMNIAAGGTTNVTVNTFGGSAEVQRMIRSNLEPQRRALQRRGAIKK